MITIVFKYRTKGGDIRYGEKSFYDSEKAIRFAWSFKNKDMVLEGWLCDTEEMDRYLAKRINIEAINS